MMSEEGIGGTMMKFCKVCVLIILGTIVLSGCDTDDTTQLVTVGPFAVELNTSYVLTNSQTGSDFTYRADTSNSQSVVQFAQSRVDSGVTIEQMASLNLQKLEVSLPGYSFVERSSRSIDCGGDHDGEIVSFITEQADNKLYHSQYYTIVDGQGYVWSVTSTVDNTRKILANIVKSAICK